MSEPVDNYRIVDLPVSKVNDNLMQCPQCGGTRITLSGDFLRHFSEDFTNGVSEGLDLAERCKLVHQISCHTCSVKFNLVPDDILNEELDYFRTKIQLAEQRGMLEAANPTVIH